jgi:hypothetical protein
MKSTSQRLAESYCRPQTEEEWKKVAGIRPLGKRFCHQKDAKSYWIENLIGVVSDDTVPHDRTEVPVPHFIDLLHDRIAPWRLADDGFAYLTPMIEVATYPIGNVTVCFHEGKTSVILDPNDSPWHSHVCSGVKTYTDLITLIQLIG